MINWFKIITDLERIGMTHVDIGDEIGKHPSLIGRYKNGMEPKHSVGELLITLHLTRCKNNAKVQSD